MTAPPNANYAPETCAWCNGSGRDRLMDSERKVQLCLSCGGKGSVLVAQPRRQCAACQGTGLSEFAVGDDNRCHVCRATGWAHRWIPS